MKTCELIAPILVQTYGASAMCEALIDHLARRIDTWEPERERSGRGREGTICLICWNWMTGGSTADRVARKIEQVLREAGR